MYELRRWLIIFTAWIFAIFSIEQLNGSVDVAWLSYAFIAAVALAILMVPFLRRLPLQVSIPIVGVLFLIVKLARGGAIWGPASPLTITELSATVLTVLFVRRLNRAVDEFQAAVAAITIWRAGKSVNPFSISQGEMYREVQRARRHNRPLSLLALKVEDDISDVALERMLKEVQQEMIDQLLAVRVAGVLNDELHDYDIIAQQNGHFLIMLPEVEKQVLPSIVTRLRHAVSERTGIEIRVGAATFPDKAVTFESLVEQALQSIEEHPSSRSSVTSAHLQTSSQEL
jgi:GGDEF domain-containing protein